MRVASGVHVWPCLVDLRVDCESCCVDGFIAYHDFAVFVDEDEVTDADLGEVAGEWVEPCWNTSVNMIRS